MFSVFSTLSDYVLTTEWPWMQNTSSNCDSVPHQDHLGDDMLAAPNMSVTPRTYPFSNFSVFSSASPRFAQGSVDSVFPTSISSDSTPPRNLQYSMDSSLTLLNTPADSPGFFQESVSKLGLKSPLLSPPGLLSPFVPKTLKDLTYVSFDNQYDASGTGWLSPDPGISPVVRAPLEDITLNVNNKPKEIVNSPSNVPSFSDRLRSVMVSTPPRRSSLPVALSSPCRIPSILTNVTKSRQSRPTNTPLREQQTDEKNVLSPYPAFSRAMLSPLTPLTPLTSPIIVSRRTRAKHRLSDSPPSPYARKKRILRKTAIAIEPVKERTRSVTPASSPNEKSTHLFSYANRTFPDHVDISPNFPQFYRRFPVSSYLQIPSTDSPCTLFSVRHPGGTYNPPRSALDLYTPRFVKGKGVEKVGLCPICIEPRERGGDNKKLWLAMKFSAFKCYHMQYAHGISASTGRPFSPPLAFRVISRPNAGKKEKTKIQQGKCPKCTKWVAIEGIKDMESKVKELYWWKHAAICHHDFTIENEGDLYEDDHILEKVMELGIF